MQTNPPSTPPDSPAFEDFGNRGKDYFIEQLQKEREGFVQERAGYVERLMGCNRKVGELEAALQQLGSGRPAKPGDAGQAPAVTG